MEIPGAAPRSLLWLLRSPVLGAGLLAASVAVALTCVASSAAQPKEDRGTGAGSGAEAAPSAIVERLFLIPSSRGPLRSVAFHYKFPDRAQVTIKGVGTVPSEGSFQYLTTETGIEFTEPGTGKVLLRLPLENPTRLMGRRAIAIPQRTDFPALHRNGRWVRPESFHQHLARLLNSKFPLGFLMDSERPNAFITSYRELEGVAEPLDGRLAVMVEPPTEQPGKPAEFRVRFVVQERSSFDDWRAMASAEVQKVAQQFVNSLIGELEGAAR